MESSEIESYKPGMKLIEIAEAIDAKILELGGDFAFPVNLSLNEIAAHYTPELGDDTIAEGILKIDLGIAIKGYIADCAFSIDLTEEGEFEELISSNEKILSEVRKIVSPELKVSDVGKKVQEVLRRINDKENKFSIIKSLSGHSLAKDMIHAGITISNYENENNKKLSEQAFAIEPFLTTGSGEIYEGKAGGIYMVEKDRPIRDPRARKLISFIKENYFTRPFCIRWLEKEGFERSKMILDILVKQRVLHSFPVLIEKTKAPVSQAEDTFIIYGNETRVTTR